MTILATAPILGVDVGEELPDGTGEEMTAWALASGYARDTDNEDEISPSFGIPLPENPTTPDWHEGSETGSDAADVSNEVQTITEGGSGLTSYVLHLGPINSAAIAAAATAAQVKAALEAMSNIGAGNVDVTGSNGGPYTVTFKNALADMNIPQMTATPTGGTGTVTVTTGTPGGVVS